MKESAHIRTLYWENDQLFLLDQTLLPHQVVFEPQQDIEHVSDSIKKLKVRGAPAIGVAAAYGLLYAVRDHLHMGRGACLDHLRRGADFLKSARPTAVNLGWALDRMIGHAASCDAPDGSSLYGALLEEAERIHQEDQSLCRKIAEQGYPLLFPGCRVLTHCNAGSLATSGWGTALAPIYLAQERGQQPRVYACETRPLLQGARLTSWELQQAGVDTTLVCDNMAASLMAASEIDLVITGCDRLAANGDAANKIGTLGLAVLARHFDVPFYIACPSSTIDPDTPDGARIVIEQRDADEICCVGDRRIAPANIKTYNPAFDVTPAALISGIITDQAILRPPYEIHLRCVHGHD